MLLSDGCCYLIVVYSYSLRLFNFCCKKFYRKLDGEEDLFEGLIFRPSVPLKLVNFPPFSSLEISLNESN